MLGTVSCNEHATEKHIERVVGRRPGKSYGHVKSLYRKRLITQSGKGDTSSLFFLFLSDYNIEKNMNTQWNSLVQNFCMTFYV